MRRGAIGMTLRGGHCPWNTSFLLNSIPRWQEWALTWLAEISIPFTFTFAEVVLPNMPLCIRYHALVFEILVFDTPDSPSSLGTNPDPDSDPPHACEKPDLRAAVSR